MTITKVIREYEKRLKIEGDIVTGQTYETILSLIYNYTN